jgi:hypothetical protein
MLIRVLTVEAGFASVFRLGQGWHGQYQRQQNHETKYQFPFHHCFLLS